STRVTDTVLLAAARALAAVVTDDELNATYIVPSVFHPDVTTTVATAVADAARRDPAQTGELRAVAAELVGSHEIRTRSRGGRALPAGAQVLRLPARGVGHAPP